MRSMLYVPGEDLEALDRALDAGADALLIALPDAGADAALRSVLRDFLQTAQLLTHRPLLFVRLPAIDAPGLDDDLSALMLAEPDGIVLGRCRGGHDVQHLGVKLAVQEAEYGLTDGETPIIAEAGSTARSLFVMSSYCDASQRLMGLMWDPHALAVDLGASSPVGATHHAPMGTARSLTLIAARAAEVSAIDGPSHTLGPAFGLECDQARNEGFNAKLALAPEQVAMINAAFDREG